MFTNSIHQFSRTPTPLQLQRFWNGWPDYKMPNQANTAWCVDGEMGTVLKAYREVLVFLLYKSSLIVLLDPVLCNRSSQACSGIL